MLSEVFPKDFTPEGAMATWRLFRLFHEYEDADVEGRSPFPLHRRPGMLGYASRVIDAAMAARLSSNNRERLLLETDVVEFFARMTYMALKEADPSASTTLPQARQEVAVLVELLIAALEIKSGDQWQGLGDWYEAYMASAGLSGISVMGVMRDARARAEVWRRFITPDLWDAWTRREEGIARHHSLEHIMVMMGRAARPGMEMAVAAQGRMHRHQQEAVLAKIAAGRERRRQEIWGH